METSIDFYCFNIFTHSKFYCNHILTEQGFLIKTFTTFVTKIMSQNKVFVTFGYKFVSKKWLNTYTHTHKLIYLNCREALLCRKSFLHRVSVYKSGFVSCFGYLGQTWTSLLISSHREYHSWPFQPLHNTFTIHTASALSLPCPVD